jgi:hypothetical protein
MRARSGCDEMLEESDPRMAGKHVRVVQFSGDDTYEQIWELVKVGAVVTVEFVRDGHQRMLATTTIVDDHGVTVDQTAVEL